ncbi:peroxiredoxin [Hazenella coriacea]|uniref:Peroxiredoxin n=1 Tax=Hazenella coriacea TaxID=1179467 RepID=A0A4R3L3S7_9BACL|nr:peroxiredoxin [Hazenella coriacea]TCS93922.1 3-Cys thioredoxin peroxidase [Hazenella coriacea]
MTIEHDAQAASIVLRIGDPAPDFEAETTKGPLKLSDFKGSWVVLFSHPSDFTPVCTTEFVAFAEKNEEFEKRNVKLLGLSIDSLFSHLAWVKNIEEHTGIQIPFPVIADLNMKVAHKYNMIHPGESDTATVRTVFLIDDRGILRAMLYYPMSNGRNMDEIIRLIDAMQISDREQVATPANWRPGSAVIIPPPKNYDDMKKRMENKEGYDYTDWYLVKKNI